MNNLSHQSEGACQVK
jgi:hypothetical protein